jgi:hypothetical protein
MHIKQWSWSDWLAIVITTILVAVIFLAHRPDSVRAKSKKIHDGMTAQQVQAIMGPGKWTKGDAWWEDEDGVLAVLFDDSGRVERAEYHSAGTFMGKIRALSSVFLDW